MCGFWLLQIVEQNRYIKNMKKKNWEFVQTLETKSIPHFSASRFTAEQQHWITQWSTQNSAGNEPCPKKTCPVSRWWSFHFLFLHPPMLNTVGVVENWRIALKHTHSWICRSKLISIWFNVIYFTCPSGTEPHNKSTSVSLKQLLPLFGSPLFGNTELVNISRSSARCVRYYQWKFLLLQHISILANFHIFSIQNVNIIIYLMAHLAI